MKQNNSSNAAVIEIKEIFTGFFSTLKTKFKIKYFDDKFSREKIYDVCKHRHAVAVLPLDIKNGYVVLVQQFRVGVFFADEDPWIYEVVAGIIEENESIEDAAIRETQEESGCLIQKLLPIASYFPSPGSSTEKVHLFCALTDIEPKNHGKILGVQEEGERIKVHTLPIKSALNLYYHGTITNGTTLIAMQWLENYLNTQNYKI